ncbi:MAG: carboxymuconolactone decarboxylase family protein [Rhodococcus sp.]|nr:carboxymuconolactone decarboxylase family protein [Rhodococcus sp. (in: high G+C Gram-positive bacteria)]
MQARMNNPVKVLPKAMKALYALSTSTDDGGVPASTIHLVHLRASQINGCGVCVDMHVKEARKDGDTDERLHAVAGWRDTPYFDDAERAALALTESVTRLSDRSDAVPDDVWNEATRYYDEAQMSALLVQIAAINAWNRLNVSTKQVAGSAV